MNRHGMIVDLAHAGERTAIEAAFARSLLTDQEMATRGWIWNEGWDGFEAWLGPIDRIA